jgi:hypothetical protein
MEKCESCGNNFVINRRIPGRNKHSYCSQNCRAEIYRKINRRKEVMAGNFAKMTLGQMQKLGLKVMVWEDSYNI